jgi:hypothetical protein
MLCCPGASISQSETEEGKTNRKLLLVVESSVWLAVAAGAGAPSRFQGCW